LFAVHERLAFLRLSLLNSTFVHSLNLNFRHHAIRQHTDTDYV
jgi:hypothetical protein